jgi:hypothetical protein
MKAFPLIDFETEEDGYIYFDSGMDLRDYFAAKAMQAMLSWENVGDFDVSKEAYMMADAMMKARGK